MRVRMRDNIRNISPWVWVPSLYFAEGIPYFLVNSISVMLFAKMGVPNDQLSFFTTLLYFPWLLKAFWSPFVDILRTKRWWIIAMQALMSGMCILVTLTMPHPSAEMMNKMSVKRKVLTDVALAAIVSAAGWGSVTVNRIHSAVSSACMAMIHHRLVRIISTNGLHSPFRNHGK